MSSNPRAEAIAAYDKPWAYVVLTKPDVTFLVVITTVAGFYLGSTGPMDWARLAHTLIGTLLVAGGTAALNQYVERDMDAVMRRTATRPLPAGTLKPTEVLIFGAVTIVLGTAWLVLAVNLLAAMVALAISLSYLGLYTPLKTRTTFATAVGAIPGALPPLIGWAAARGSLSEGGWILFAILFVWQFPHFYAIAWMYKEDYARAGIQMLPVVEPDCRSTARQIVLYGIALIPVSLVPAMLGMSGRIYLVGALLLGLWFLYSGVRVALDRTLSRARGVLVTSVLYLPLIYGLMLLDRPGL